MKHVYTPDENDTERLKDAYAAIELLPTDIKPGTVDGKIREVIESHFSIRCKIASTYKRLATNQHVEVVFGSACTLEYSDPNTCELFERRLFSK